MSKTAQYFRGFFLQNVPSQHEILYQLKYFAYFTHFFGVKIKNNILLNY